MGSAGGGCSGGNEGAVYEATELPRVATPEELKGGSMKGFGDQGKASGREFRLCAAIMAVTEEALLW